MQQLVASGWSYTGLLETVESVCKLQQWMVTLQVRGQEWLEQPWTAVSDSALPLPLALPCLGQPQAC